MTLHSNIFEIDKVQWDMLVRQSPTASFFQTRACYDFYASLSFLTPFVYGVSENDKLVGLMCGYLISDGNKIKQYFSRRAIVPGGLLLDTTISDAAIRSLLQLVRRELSRRTIYIEIRNFSDFSTFRSSIQSAGFDYQPHLNFRVATPAVASALSGLSDSKKRQIKTAKKTGVEWMETTDKRDVKAFYEVLRHLYVSKVKTPLFPLEFFEKQVELPGGKLLVVKHKGKIVGGMACVGLAGKVLYEWFVCGDSTSNKTAFASVVATWAGIEYAAAHNYNYFDFMGAGKPDKAYGVREFKGKFGGELLENGRFLYICKPILFFIGKKIISIYKSIV